MTEAVAIEAVRAAGSANALQGVVPASATADPAAVAAFQQAYGTSGVQGPSEVPFAAQVQRAWRSAEVGNQAHLHRLESLQLFGATHGVNVAQLSALQYEVATMAFDLEVTTLVAKKTGDAISTLVKNG